MADVFAVIPAHTAAGSGVSFDNYREALQAATAKSGGDGVRRLVVRVHAEVVRQPEPLVLVQRQGRATNAR